MVVYKGQPAHWFDTHYHKTHLVETELKKTGEMQAYGGDTATFTDVRPWNDHAIALYFNTKAGKRGLIRIHTLNKEKPLMEDWQQITNEIATVDWIDSQLTQSTVSFIGSNARTSTVAATPLPAPPTELSLTPTKTSENASKPQATPAPALSNIAVSTSPSHIKRGETVQLVLEYSLDTGNQSEVEVKESLFVHFKEKLLPTYPKERTKSIDAGNHRVVFKQKIPAGANPGTYTYKGEVCIESGCSYRTTRFVVEP